MTTNTHCPKCKSEYSYQSGDLWICSECAHEWIPGQTSSSETEENVIKDAHGNILKDGDSITIIKDLKVKGSSSVIKVGTKVKSIRLVDGADGHNIACKIDGFGAMNLKSEFVKKT